MTVSKNIGVSFVLVAAVSIILSAGPAGQPATRPATRPAGALLKHLKIDRPGRRVIVDATVMLRKGMLEFLMCAKGAKDHETLFVTDVKPSSLHAALLALGLAPGRAAQWVTPAGKKPVFISPAGAALIITVRWTDKKGAAHEVPVTDWMMEVATKKKMHKTRWVFVGSDFLDNGRYWADVEGLHISVTNFASAVIDVPFESTSANAPTNDLREFGVNTASVPPKGTPVKLILQAAKGAETAPAARMTFDIDAAGRIKLDGGVVAPENISKAVRGFLSRHADASASVRIDARALVFDRERLREILEQAGLTRITFTTRALRAEILPRTPAEAKKAIKWWKGQFADEDEYPAEDAAATLKHIKRRIKQSEALCELWGDYAAGLKKALNEYNAQQKKKKESGK